jgi:hypothetical protein
MKVLLASKLWSQFRPSGLVSFAVLVACGFAVWALVNSWRYETHPLSTNSYVLEDRLAGRVYYCHFETCRAAGSVRAAEPSGKKVGNAAPLVVQAPSQSSAEDFSRLNDDQFMDRMLELTRDSQGAGQK